MKKKSAKKRKKVLTSLCVLSLAIVGSGCFGQGSAPFAQAAKNSEQIQKEIDKTSGNIEKAEKERKRLDKEIAQIEEKKEDVLSYLEELDNKVTDLEEQIEQNQEEIDDKEQEIEDLREQISQTEEKKQDQYDTMKERIKYMYENGNGGYWDVILGAESLSDLLNRAEYVNRVTEYDNHLFDRYRETCEQLEQTELALEEELDALKELQASLEVKKESVDTLIENKTAELDRYNEMTDTLTEEEKQQEQILEQQDEQLESLLEQKRQQIAREEAKRAAQQAAAEAEAAETSSDQTTAGLTPGTSSTAGFTWPLPVSGTITSTFGYRTAPTAGASTYHKGIDISVPTGTSILASKAGEVVTATYSSSSGNYICLYHGDGVYTYYMHCSAFCVSVGENVSAGQTIALSGNTGISTGPHLHFAIYIGGSYVDPLAYVSP